MGVRTDAPWKHPNCALTSRLPGEKYMLYNEPTCGNSAVTSQDRITVSGLQAEVGVTNGLVYINNQFMHRSNGFSPTSSSTTLLSSTYKAPHFHLFPPLHLFQLPQWHNSFLVFSFAAGFFFFPSCSWSIFSTCQHQPTLESIYDLKSCSVTLFSAFLF